TPPRPSAGRGTNKLCGAGASPAFRVARVSCGAHTPVREKAYAARIISRDPLRWLRYVGSQRPSPRPNEECPGKTLNRNFVTRLRDPPHPTASPPTYSLFGTRSIFPDTGRFHRVTIYQQPNIRQGLCTLPSYSAVGKFISSPSPLRRF